MSDYIAANRRTNFTYIRMSNVGHVTSWNADPVRYIFEIKKFVKSENLLLSFMDDKLLRFSKSFLEIIFVDIRKITENKIINDKISFKLVFNNPVLSNLICEKKLSFFLQKFVKSWIIAIVDFLQKLYLVCNVLEAKKPYFISYFDQYTP